MYLYGYGYRIIVTPEKKSNSKCRHKKRSFQVYGAKKSVLFYIIFTFTYEL